MRKVLGKVPTYAIAIVAVVIIAGIVAGMTFKLVKPQQAVLAELENQISAESQVAAQKDSAEAELASVSAKWEDAEAELLNLQGDRSFPISTYQPIGAMIALWYEYREDLPRVTSEWITSTGVTLDSSITFPTPDMAPPSVPANGFIALPAVNVSISGSLENIEEFYASLADFRRVAVISGMKLSGVGQEIQCSTQLTTYLLVEGPASAGGGAASSTNGMTDPAMAGAMGPEMPPEVGAPGAEAEPAGAPMPNAEADEAPPVP